MISDIYHIGLTVSDLERSIGFYRDVLGLEFQGRLTMEDAAAATLFGRKGCRAEVAYLKRSDREMAPPVELICFTDQTSEQQTGSLFRTSISEICFYTDDIWKDYRQLKEKGVELLSEPQTFDFTADGFGKSLAVYLKDPDGIILELMQPLE